MRRSLRTLGLALMLLMAQMAVAAIFPRGARPDLILIFALAMGLRAGRTGSLISSFFLGFAVDSVSGSPLGLYALLRGTACAATRLFDRALFIRSPLLWALYAAGYSVLDGLLLGVVLNFLAPEAAVPWGTLLLRLPISAVLTGGVAAPILAVAQRWDTEDPREVPRASLASRVRS